MTTTVELDAFIEIAREAGNRILQYYGKKDPAPEEKADGSPVTKADLASHEYICAELTRRFNLPVLSEEAVVDYETRKHWKKFFIVDPLDGTKDFLARTGEFAVNIALISGDRPVAGVIFGPATRECFCAAEGKGAWLVAFDGARTRLPVRRFTGKHIACVSRFHDAPRSQQFILENRVEQRLHIGSSLKFGKIASGDATVYGRYQYTSEWDTAPGDLIIHEAGGRMVDLTTNAALRYNKPDTKNSFFIAATAGVDLTRLTL